MEPATAFDAIPAGKYPAVITASEMKPTKSGTGRYLELNFQIIDGQYKNRRLWARLNLENANVTAVQIAKAELSAICRAVGVLAPSDSTELHNLPLVIDVRCKKRADTGEISNEIRAYARKECPSPVTNPAVTGCTAPWREPSPPVTQPMVTGRTAPWSKS